MGLFGRKQAQSMPEPSQLDLIGGSLFEASLRLGIMPPAGPAFINRFLHGDPFAWVDDFGELRDGMSDRNALNDSLHNLATALDELERSPAPVGIITALEDAVTLNLTGLAVDLASAVLADRPDLVGHAAIAGIDDGWSGRPEVSGMALIIREAASAMDAALLSAGIGAGPGVSMRCGSEAMVRATAEIADKGTTALERMDPIFANPLDRHTDQMARALRVVKLVT